MRHVGKKIRMQQVFLMKEPFLNVVKLFGLVHCLFKIKLFIDYI